MDRVYSGMTRRDFADIEDARPFASTTDRLTGGVSLSSWIAIEMSRTSMSFNPFGGAILVPLGTSRRV